MEESEAGRPRLPSALAVWPSFVLARVAQRANEVFELHLKTIGIRARQYAVMAILADEGPQSQHALGLQLGIDRTSMVAAHRQPGGDGPGAAPKGPRRPAGLCLTPD